MNKTATVEGGYALGWRECVENIESAVRMGLSYEQAVKAARTAVDKLGAA